MADPELEPSPLPPDGLRKVLAEDVIERNFDGRFGMQGVAIIVLNREQRGATERFGPPPRKMGEKAQKQNDPPRRF